MIVVLHSRLELRAIRDLLSAGYAISTISTPRLIVNVAHREQQRSNVVPLRTLTHSKVLTS